MDLEKFTERLSGCFFRSKMTIKELSMKTGVSQSAICRYINDGVIPNVRCLAAICKGLDVSADYLLFGDKDH